MKVQMVLSAVVLIATADKAIAQNYRIEPNDTFIINNGNFENLETLIINQRNISSDTIRFAWHKVSESVPVNWEASICDNVTCNTNLADSGMMDPVTPDKSGFLLLHITPHQNYGTAVIRYSVWDLKTPNLKDTLTFIMSTSNSTGINEENNNVSFRITPNPATTNLTIYSDLATRFAYSIFGQNGSLISDGLCETKIPTILLTGIPEGVYTLLIKDKNKVIITKKVIIHH